MNNRCTARTKSGEQCRNFALHGEDKCITHSQSPRARGARKRRKILSREDMILELQRQLRKVKRLEREEDSLEVSREVRMLLAQIAELRGIVEPGGEGEGEEGQQARRRRPTFNEIVEEEIAEKEKRKQENEEEEVEKSEEIL